MHCHNAWGLWSENSCSASPHCLKAVGKIVANALLHCRDAQDKELVQHTATLPRGSGQGILVVHRHTAWGQEAVELLQRTTTMPRSSGQGTVATPRHTARGQWAVELL